MPLLVCPSCETKAPMSAVQRHGVEFDVCTTCRGVWLDRGELEKLLEATREDREGERTERASFQRDRDEFYQDPDAYRQRQPQPAPRQDYGERGERGEHGERGEGGYDPRTGKRRKRFDLFDIFD